MSYAFEGSTTGLLIQETPRRRVALHEIAVGGLKLRPVVYRTAPESVTCILRHIRSPVGECRHGYELAGYKG